MWSNLLSGSIGAVIGVVGAFGASVWTIGRTRRHEHEAARREHALRVSGDLAHSLVEFYDQLRTVVGPPGSDDQSVDTGDLVEAAIALRRAITVDAPLLDTGLETGLRQLREELGSVVPRWPRTVSTRELGQLLASVRRLGDELRELRRNQFVDAPVGLRLTGGA